MAYRCTSLVLMYCHLQACSCRQINAYFENISPCRVGSLAPGCCPSTLFLSECENCGSCIKKFCWSSFINGILSLWKISTNTVLHIILYTVVLCAHLGQAWVSPTLTRQHCSGLPRDDKSSPYFIYVVCVTIIPPGSSPEETATRVTQRHALVVRVQTGFFHLPWSC